MKPYKSSTLRDAYHIFFLTKADTFVTIVIRHLSGNISSEDITIALQELTSDFIRVTLMNAKRAAQERGVTHFMPYS
jgi:hypothetical protein